MTDETKITGCGGRIGCNNSPTEEAHPCPYQADVNDDHEDHCNCCDSCQQECCDDI